MKNFINLLLPAVTDKEPLEKYYRRRRRTNYTEAEKKNLRKLFAFCVAMVVAGFLTGGLILWIINIF